MDQKDEGHSEGPDLNRLRESVRKARGMTKERQGEIAILFLKNQLRREGITLTNTKRKVNATASEIGIPVTEAQKFVEILVRELVEETFSNKWGDGGDED